MAPDTTTPADQADRAQNAIGRTYLAFQHNAKLTTLSTVVRAILPAATLEDVSRSVFKGAPIEAEDHVVITDATIFHPQGGGQPSDTGTMTAGATTFHVSAVRTDPLPARDGQVLHLGRFAPASAPFTRDAPVTQTIDADKRLLFSRLHTAGHVLGAAVRHLYGATVPDFDELKASHFPDAASCEFRGKLEGAWKPAIQARLDDYLARDMPVEIDFWTADDFRREGLERLIPDPSLVAPGEKFRVVKIVGAEVYPCGGTHVDSTRGCGKTTVRKISRQKGTSKVSYAVE